MRIAFHSRNKAKIILYTHAATVSQPEFGITVGLEVLKAALLMIQIVFDRTLC
jgi:hypothetical protein